MWHIFVYKQIGKDHSTSWYHPDLFDQLGWLSNLQTISTIGRSTLHLQLSKQVKQPTKSRICPGCYWSHTDNICTRFPAWSVYTEIFHLFNNTKGVDMYRDILTRKTNLCECSTTPTLRDLLMWVNFTKNQDKQSSACPTSVTKLGRLHM